MPGEDRERTFEKALARHLRANPANGPDAQDSACPDPEVLAAYHERMLAPEQMTSWKEHIALCLRCQEILARLEASDELPVGVSDVEEAAKVLPMVAISEPQRGTAERAHGPVLAASAPSVTAITTFRETPQSRRAVRWRWIAPAGAIAAGLLVWIVVRQNHAPEFELAKNQASRVVVPESAPPTPPAPSLQKQSEPGATKSADSNSSLGARPESRQAPSEAKPARPDNFRAGLKQKTAGVPSENAKKDRDRGVPADKSALTSDGRQSDLSAVAKDELEERKDGAEFANRAASAPPLAPAPPKAGIGGAASGIVGGRESGKPASDQDLRDARKEPAAAAAQSLEIQSETQTINGAVRTKALPQVMRLARGQASVVILAPGGKSLWRASPAGVVEHSTNAGSTWKLQRTGVIADLIAGSAPSDEVCWIVGRSGMILRTIDRGTHWVKIQAPVEDDLATILAVDAEQATIYTASMHKAYRTTDGGLTWTAVTDR